MMNNTLNRNFNQVKTNIIKEDLYNNPWLIRMPLEIRSLIERLTRLIFGSYSVFEIPI